MVPALCKALPWLFNSKRNLNLYEGWKAPADRSLSGLCPHHSHSPTIPLFHPQGASCIYNMPRVLPQGLEIAVSSASRYSYGPCLTSCEPLLQCQLISEDLSSIPHKIAPFLSTLSFYPPYSFSPKLLSPSDIYFYLFFSLFPKRK